MQNKLKKTIKKIPIIREIAEAAYSLIGRIFFPGTGEYWEKRYFRGGTTGEGSYGKFAQFKAEVINDFVKSNKINSVIELGCGDGNQISLLNIPNYIGLDVSKTAVKKCIERFKDDKGKSFVLYDPLCFLDNHPIPKAELGLSLDVIFHLIEYELFERYMQHLFSISSKFVIIYSSDTDNNKSSF